MRNDIDMEAAFFMLFMGLKEEKNKEYSMIEARPNIAYVFANDDEFKNYFIDNGCENIDSRLLELCKIKTTKKGSIIAMKGSCDSTITSNVSNKININPIIHSSEKIKKLALKH